jgi:lipoprotein-releasing system permease protein
LKYELTIALRYLWSARKRVHTAFLSLISTLVLTVGVATLIISLALLSGLQGRIKERLMSASPHLLLEPAESNTIDDAPQVTKALQDLHAKSIEPIVSGIAWAYNEKQQAGRPVRLRSYVKATEPPAEKSFGREWSFPPQEAIPIYVTREFASAIGLFLGDDVVIVSPRTRLTPFGPAPVWRKFRIARVVASPPQEQGPEAYVSFADASSLFFTEDKPTSIEVWFPNISEVDPAHEKIAAAFPSLVTKSWKDINRPLFLALRLEKVVMFATISLIIFVAALNLISSLSMLIVEKKARVGILRTLGASERSILTIFLIVGLLIGLTGMVLGNVIGLGVSWAANRYHLVPLPSDMYFVTYIPFTIEWPDVIGVNVIAVVLSVFATWYPARLASRLDPIVAIREE